MREKVVFGVLVLVLVLPLVAATQTDITVKTEPRAYVTTYISDPVSEDIIIQRDEAVDESGIYSDTFSTDFTKVNIEIKARNSQNVILGKYEVQNYDAKEPLVIDFREEAEEEVEQNETEVEDNETEIIEEETEELEETEPGITGGAIKNILSGKTKKVIFYGIGALVLIAILGFVVARGMHKFKSRTSSEPKEIRVKKLSEIKTEQSGEEDERITKAEEKIKEAQQELKKIKNEEKIKSMEKKIEEDRKRLERLRAGEDD